MNFIDLFAGAGGLSEGFIKAGFKPIAHVESDTAACYTLMTRQSYYFLKKIKKEEIYNDYLMGKITREKLYSFVPKELLLSVINKPIGSDNRYIFHEIDKHLNNQDVTLLIGGPPCQAYSVVGRPALKHKTDDKRKLLYIYYGKFLLRYKPEVFIFENVPGIYTAENGKYIKHLEKYFKKIGYTLDHKILDASDFGVIQNRKRVIIIGWKNKLNIKYPNIEPLKKIWSVENIFSDLPSLSPGDYKRILPYKAEANEYLKKFEIRNGLGFVSQNYTRPHNSRDLKIYSLAIDLLINENKRIKNNEIPLKDRTQKNITSFLDRFKVVNENDLSHTVIAHIAKDGHYYIHPDKSQLRSISVREAARIQSFPDDYYFESVDENQARSAAFRQIGNAVPPLMAYAIAKNLKRQICNL